MFNLLGYIQDYFVENIEQIGGVDEFENSKIVEIDESIFFKRKYNRRYLEVLNGFWRDRAGFTKHVMILVLNRSSATLILLIRQYITPGSKITTDCWAAYNLISLDQYFLRFKINHSLYFIDPKNSLIHTQTIENCWLHAKKA